MSLIVGDLSIELLEKLRPLVPRIKARDKSLADQIQRAANSIALGIGEAVYSDPGNQRAPFHTAAGSAGETLAACAWLWRGESSRGRTARLPRCSIGSCRCFGS